MDYIRQEEIKKFDEIILEGDIKVVVDSKAIMALVGT
jgi:Fe-S cluster assembly iron-binding protein IscA